MMCVGPLHDLSDREGRSTPEKMLAPVLGQELSQCSPAAQPSIALRQGCVDAAPGLARGLWDVTIFTGWPGARAPAMGISPDEDLLLGQVRDADKVPGTALLSQQLGQ